ncbi:hypothetical protein BIW11_14051 [Tropilaelaps mercedesae]|uniref:DUF4758 domain-containing protein n=1 Tax=Tropilaelaps mercedesae TaxID=418985 RepID=A0A1V9WZR4_9ACAR|nr:hypothetical protein BIW11_14051 [Tropilaelaps mercedesae]
MSRDPTSGHAAVSADAKTRSTCVPPLASAIHRLLRFIWGRTSAAEVTSVVAWSFAFGPICVRVRPPSGRVAPPFARACHRAEGSGIPQPNVTYPFFSPVPAFSKTVTASTQRPFTLSTFVVPPATTTTTSSESGPSQAVYVPDFPADANALDTDAPTAEGSADPANGNGGHETLTTTKRPAPVLYRHGKILELPQTGPDSAAKRVQTLRPHRLGLYPTELVPVFEPSSSSEELTPVLPSSSMETFMALEPISSSLIEPVSMTTMDPRDVRLTRTVSTPQPVTQASALPSKTSHGIDKTVTLFGFVDFTTSLSGTKIVFKPTATRRAESPQEMMAPASSPHDFGHLFKSSSIEPLLPVRPAKLESPARKFGSTSSRNAAAINPPAIQPSQTKSDKYKTGLVKSKSGTTVNDGVTTEFTTLVYGTFIQGSYAHVIRSTSSIYATPTSTMDATTTTMIGSETSMASAGRPLPVPEGQGEGPPAISDSHVVLDGSLSQVVPSAVIITEGFILPGAAAPSAAVPSAAVPSSAGTSSIATSSVATSSVATSSVVTSSVTTSSVATSSAAASTATTSTAATTSAAAPVEDISPSATVNIITPSKLITSGFILPVNRLVSEELAAESTTAEVGEASTEEDISNAFSMESLAESSKTIPSDEPSSSMTIEYFTPNRTPESSDPPPIEPTSITVFTTYTHFTTAYNSGTATLVSSHEVVSNVHRMLPRPSSESSSSQERTPISSLPTESLRHMILIVSPSSSISSSVLSVSSETPPLTSAFSPSPVADAPVPRSSSDPPPKTNSAAATPPPPPPAKAAFGAASSSYDYTTYTYYTTFIRKGATSITSRTSSQQVLEPPVLVEAGEIYLNAMSARSNVDMGAVSASATTTCRGGHDSLTPHEAPDGYERLQRVVSNLYVATDPASIAPTASVQLTGPVTSTYFTTYTYYTTFFRRGSSRIKSREKVETNLVTIHPPSTITATTEVTTNEQQQTNNTKSSILPCFGPLAGEAAASER